MKITKALFVLPTLFTLSSVFFGFLSLVMSREGDFVLASTAVLYAILFDMVDGRVARMTRTQSEFGIQIDSLADVCSFGMAPAFLIYSFVTAAGIPEWLENTMLAICFLYVACGAIRLARFNVMAGRSSGPMKRFVGMPIPTAAGIMAALVLGTSIEGLRPPLALVAVFMILVSLLMVSSVSYRKFFARNRLEAALLGPAALAFLAAVMIAWGPEWLPFGFLFFYMAFGMVETVISRLYARRRREAAQTDEPDGEDA